MKALLPRLPAGLAASLFDDGVANLKPSLSHPAQVYAPVGGARADEHKLAEARTMLFEVAVAFGFPDVPPDAGRIAFDRAAAAVIVIAFDLTWAEAGARDVWSFVSLVLMPDITRWRFSDSVNRERWIATDLTRHMWSRLWWQGTIFGNDDDLLRALSESDLNQLLERRSIGGDPNLVRSLGRAVVQSERQVTRRELIRESTARIRRRLAFIDARTLSQLQLDAMCAAIVDESASAILDWKAASTEAVSL
ncbi:hypothetical protein ITJ66_14165 [Plantibacter sp. VKM Ac-2885]|uniref:Uncharacterized protein n=1 Tax=Plantibacter elymi (nom. nud.) TaxID=199708 RepID=A0ABY1RHE2_9MICO|nr:MULTISPECIES: DUF6339 family protein [unclassified Plantibacter]MBF4513631.1 hypothetical protein [Plantibacter sp. VKM Ac-2885]SMQ73137.1 hypothetical protein SAMN06295909_3122 [Plantibacter sp. VKM Ac-1784]